MICADSRIGKQAPVLDLKRRPDAGRILNGIANELSLTSELEIDIVLVVLALDVGHVDGDEDVGLKFFEAQEGKCDGCEVGGGRLVAGLADVRCLRRDEGIRRCSSSAGIISQYHEAKNGITVTYSSLLNSVSAVFQILTVSMSEPTISSRCAVIARPSISGPVPDSPTRSVMSKIMLVKPSWSIQTS